MGAYDYYRNYCVCSGIPIWIGMHDLEGDETSRYPVNVYNVNNELIGQAAGKAEFIEIWNGDTSNQELGVLSSGFGPFGFNLDLEPGQDAPPYVIGEFDGVVQTGIYAVQYENSYE